MSDPHQVQSFKLSRRHFNQISALAAIGILAGGLTSCGDSPESPTIVQRETYHIFIGAKLAQEGGKQTVTLKSGNVKTLSISKRTTEKTEIALRNAALDGGDAAVVLHTLYDPLIDIDGLIEQAIFSAPLLKATRDRCRDIYQQVKSGDPIGNPQALDVLDAVVAGSSQIRKDKNGKTIQERYKLASQNVRLVELQTYIEESIDQSETAAEHKQQLKGIYQYVRSGEALPSTQDFDALSAIDAIVQGSSLPIPIRQRYAVASAQTRAYTADEAIQNLIRTKYQDEKEVKPYLEAYNDVRIGRDVKNKVILALLDSLVDKSTLPRECKAIYKLARNHFFEQDEQQVEDELQKYLQAGRQAAATAADIVPTMTQVFAAGGVTAGTGTALGTLSGRAAINATLATLGGGSVAAGGLGMLGGLAVVTGGAALVGAAALVSVSVVAGMPKAELEKLGVAATAGTLASATIMGTAWAVASTFLIAGDLAGAAAISATIAALGGVSVMTGGAALIAFGVGLGVWQFLKNDDASLEATLRQIEPTLYIIAESEQTNYALLPILKSSLKQFREESDEAYLTPDIPLDKLSNALSNYASLNRDEKVLAMVDMSVWDSGKAGITFTDLGVWWKYMSSPNFVEYSDPDYLFKIKDLPTYGSDKEAKGIYELAWKLHIDVVSGMTTL
jgi:hypothetical protein